MDVQLRLARISLIGIFRDSRIALWDAVAVGAHLSDWYIRPLATPWAARGLTILTREKIIIRALKKDKLTRFFRPIRVVLPSKTYDGLVLLVGKT